MNEVFLTLEFAGVVVRELAKTGIEVVRDKLFGREDDAASDDRRDSQDDSAKREQRSW